MRKNIYGEVGKKLAFIEISFSYNKFKIDYFFYFLNMQHAFYICIMMDKTKKECLKIFKIDIKFSLNF